MLNTISEEIIFWEQMVVLKRYLPLQDITQAVDFVGNHGKVNYIFDCKFVLKYLFL